MKYSIVCITTCLMKAVTWTVRNEWEYTKWKIILLDCSTRNCWILDKICNVYNSLMEDNNLLIKIRSIRYEISTFSLPISEIYIFWLNFARQWWLLYLLAVVCPQATLILFVAFPVLLPWYESWKTASELDDYS